MKTTQKTTGKSTTGLSASLFTIRRFSIIFITTAIMLFSFNLYAGGQKEKATGGKTTETTAKKITSIAVFVPGVVAGSPIYEQLVAGAKKAAQEEGNVTVKIVEGGFNQAEWPDKITSLVATGQYGVLVTSNPAMPQICANIASNFPKQKFLCMDGYLEGNPQIHTVLYNQIEEGYLVGYLAGLVTKSKMKGATPDSKIGMIVGQHYPVLDKIIRPGFEKGIKASCPDATLDFRVVGNWYDANKAAELANSMFSAGVDVILPIAGGANQGVIKAAKDKGKYVVYFDSNGYNLAPGVILGCSILRQEKATYERVKAAIEGKLKYGEAEILGIKEGYVDFIDTDPLYKKSLPQNIRDKMATMLKEFRSGKKSFNVPKL